MTVHEMISVHHTAGHLSEFLAVLGVILHVVSQEQSCSSPSFALYALSVQLHPSSIVQPCHLISSPSPSIFSFLEADSPHQTDSSHPLT